MTNIKELDDPCSYLNGGTSGLHSQATSNDHRVFSSSFTSRGHRYIEANVMITCTVNSSYTHLSCSNNVFIASFLSGMLTPTLAINSTVNYTGPTSGRSMPSHTVGVSTYENHIEHHSLLAEGSARECTTPAFMSHNDKY